MSVLKNPHHEKFAAGLAKGLSANQAYIKAGYSKRGSSGSASKLAKNPSIVQREAEIVAQYTATTVEVEQRSREALTAYEISHRDVRVFDYDDVRHRIRRVIEERAADPTMANVPGGKSGMLVRKWTTVNITETVIVKGRDGQDRAISVNKVKELPEYSFDTGLAQSLLNFNKQAAVEKGDWTEKRETKHTGTLDVSITDARRRLHSELIAHLTPGRTLEGHREVNGGASNGSPVRLEILGAGKSNGTTG